MQELMGRVTALDPSVSQGLKVISYFDALVAGGVNLETLVRGAAALTGTVAGLDAAGGVIRVDETGRRLDDPAATADGWDVVTVENGARVWLERRGAPHANDAMVLERLSLAVAVVRARRMIVPDDALSVAIDTSRSADERAVAATRLRVGGPVRAVATPPHVTPSGPSALVATPHGVIRASLVGPDEVPIAQGGLGRIVRSDDIAASWSTALVAYRLSDSRRPVVDAEELGVLLDAVAAAEHAAADHPDVRALRGMDERTLEILDALVAAESVRAAALVLGVHHSTLQARRDGLLRELGYDPRTAAGTARYEVARLLDRLARADRERAAR